MSKNLIAIGLFLIFLMSFNFAWCSGTDCNTDWAYKQELELNTEGILTSDVTNEHAILVHVDSSNTDFWNNSEILNDVNDVRFTNSDDSIDLNYHFESVDTDSNDLWAWVRVPEFDADANTIVNMYYGNPDAVDNQNEEGTYPDDYLAVWHMNTLLDSTQYNHDFTNTSGETIVTSGCKIGQCYDFDTGDYLWEQTGSGPLENASSDNFTMWGWVNNDDVSDNSLVFGEAATSGSRAMGLISANNSTIGYKFQNGASYSGYNVSANNNTTYNYVGVYDTVNGLTQYRDYTTVNTSAYVALDRASSVGFVVANTFYSPTSNLNPFDGSVDEIKVFDYSLDSNEVALLFYSESDDLITFGSQEALSLYWINADFNSLIDETNSRVYLYDTSTDLNVTINSWAWLVNGTQRSTDQNFYYSTNANQDLNTCLIASGTGDDGNTYTDSICQSVKTWDTISPTISVTLNPETYGFVTDFGIDYNMTCYDNFSPINYIITWNNGTTNTELYNSEDTNASLLSDTFDLNAGQQATLTFTCKDDYNNTAIYTTDTIYSLQFRLIDEDTGNLFDLNNLIGATAYTYDGNNEYDFKDTNTTIKNFFSDSTVVRFDFTYDDESETKISREIDFDYIDDTNVPVCVAKFQTLYEQIFVSESEKPLVLFNDYAECYNLVSKTKFVYETSLMNRAFTINKPYYAYIYSNGVKSLLAVLDGAKASEINLDILEFNESNYELNMFYDTLTFNPVLNSVTGKYDTNTLRIYFKTLADDSTSTTLNILQNNSSIWSYTETDEPNEFFINFYYGDFDIDLNELLTIQIEKTVSGETETITKYFTLEGSSYAGSINEFVAIIIAILLILAGLTMTSFNTTFGWFGLFIEGLAIGILAFAPGYWYVTFLQGIIVIIMIFTFLVAKNETGGII